MKGLKNLYNQDKGEIASNIAINWFIENGFTVYKAVVDIEKVDFIVRKVVGGGKVKPHYYEMQSKGSSSEYPVFKVPRIENVPVNPDYFYLLVHLYPLNNPRIYLLTQQEVRKKRYSHTRQLPKAPKKFESSTVIIRLNEEERKRDDINLRYRQGIFKRKNKA